MDVTRTLYTQKAAILRHLRDRAEESYGEVERVYGVRDFKERGAAINKAISATTANIKSIIIQRAIAQTWTKNEILQNILMLTYCSYVVMLEFRNRAWPYEYMAFSRRVGELWEPFCKLCFDYPVREDVELIEPPLFSEVRERLQEEIRLYITGLQISDGEKQQLLSYYDKAWLLVTSGEIKLELDLHFRIGDTKYNVDFKSGFQSNEKGNTNRLLLVASIYKNIIGENNNCLLFVRANECDNNHYLQTLRRSRIWDVSCGAETYEKIHEYSGFNLTDWVTTNIQWSTDFSADTHAYLEENDLVKYLTW